MERGFIEGNELNTKLLTIARFNLEWPTDGKDSLKNGAPATAQAERRKLYFCDYDGFRYQHGALPQTS